MNNSRTLGTLPISVGTSLALEALPNAPMYKYNSFLINIRTIIRNARSAFDNLDIENQSTIKRTINEVFEASKEDIIKLAEYIVSLKLKTELKLIFYYPSYKSLPRMFPLASLTSMSTKKTSKQKATIHLEKEVAELLIKEFGVLIKTVDSSIPSFLGLALILSHHPVDLVTNESYVRLNILESHTGNIKNYTLFYTKLTNAKELTNIPLNKLTIQIFGDNSIDFYASSIGIKNEIKQLAEAAKWSTASTPSFVSRTIRSLNNSPEKNILLKMI